MEDNFRNVLIIISAIVIAAIFIHGFWTIRKNKNPYKLKAKNEKVEPVTRGFDSSGFDQDGVGKVRVISGDTLNDDEIPNEPAPAPEFHEDPLPKDLEKPQPGEMTLEPTLGDLSDIKEQPPVDSTPPQAQTLEQAPVIEPAIEITAQEEQPVYAAPVSKPKPTRAKKSKTKLSKAEIKKNQMGFDFDDSLDDDDMPSMSAIEDDREEKAPEVTPEVIVVSVVVGETQTISGAALLPTLLTLGLRYGDMNIFHRHEDNAGNGKVTFSLANMMNPGTFDLDEMESFTTQGISLFMTLPNAGDPFEVFDNMMSAAKQIAMEFNGQLLDDKRSVMTKQTEQHYIGKIREFDRLNRIAQA